MHQPTMSTMNLHERLARILTGNSGKRNPCPYQDDYREGSKQKDFGVSTTDIAAAALVELAENSFSDRISKRIAQERTCKQKTNSDFPMKLMHVLDCPKYADIISWTPDGKSFVINNPSNLVDTVLRLEFKMNYDGFMRKLHRLGFTKIVRGNNFGCFYNENFQRGIPELCLRLPGRTTISLPDFSTTNNYAELCMEDMLENENMSIAGQQSTVRHDFASFPTTNTRQLTQPYCPPTDDIAPVVQGDGIQSSEIVAALPSYYLSRMVDSSGLHKKIIRDALHSLIIENTRLNLASAKPQQDLILQDAVRALDVHGIAPTTLDLPSERYRF